MSASLPVTGVTSAPSDRICANPGCGASIDLQRADARYCGGPCRAAASRARPAAKPPGLGATLRNALNRACKRTCAVLGALWREGRR
jgi:hypothetical protein